MTNEEKVAYIQKLLEDYEISTEIIDKYLEIAGKKIINIAYPYSKDELSVPPKYEMLQIEIAMYLINKMGADGEVSHTENGISRLYENADIPKSMLSIITPSVGVLK